MNDKLWMVNCDVLKYVMLMHNAATAVYCVVSFRKTQRRREKNDSRLLLGYSALPTSFCPHTGYDNMNVSLFYSLHGHSKRQRSHRTRTSYVYAVIPITTNRDKIILLDLVAFGRIPSVSRSSNDLCECSKTNEIYLKDEKKMCNAICFSIKNGASRRR